MLTKSKIVFVLPSSVGGAERVTITIAKILDRNSYDITMLIMGQERGYIEKFIPSYMDIKFLRIRNIWDFVTIKLWKIFRNLQPDYVFCSAIYLNPRVIASAKIGCGAKIIIRNNIGMFRIRKDNQLLTKLLYPLADIIILQTKEMETELRSMIPNLSSEKIVTIPNPIDIDYIKQMTDNQDSPFDSGYINYVFVGRISHDKGIDVLIPAFARLLKGQPKSRLYLVGKINDDMYYRNRIHQIKELELQDNIIWTGFTKNPYVYEKYADCFVLPSRIEGLPNVVLDAMYLKTPVVVTRSVPVIDRLVTEDRGIVVDTEDVQGLTDAMKEAPNLHISNKYVCNSGNEFRKLFELV